MWEAEEKLGITFGLLMVRAEEVGDIGPSQAEKKDESFKHSLV